MNSARKDTICVLLALGHGPIFGFFIIGNQNFGSPLLQPSTHCNIQYESLVVGYLRYVYIA